MSTTDNQTLDNYTAVGRAKGFIPGTEAEIIESWQYLIDTGLAWSLQGFFGRTAMALIEQGICWAPWGGVESAQEGK